MIECLIAPILAFLVIIWFVSSPMMSHRERKCRPKPNEVPKKTLAVLHEEVCCGFSGSDTFYTYYITNGIEWRKINKCFGRLLSIFYLITFQWHRRLKY